MQTTVLTGIATTRSPLSHIKESISTGTLLNERPFIQNDNSIEDVFIYNGNAWRGQLRDCAALYLLEKLEIKELSLETHNFLFSGGKIGGASKFKLENIKRHYDLLPVFSIFGGCLDNMMLPGKLSVFDFLPICKETKSELPEEFHEKADKKTYKDMTIEREFTRFDDAKNMKLNQTLSSSETDAKEATAMRMNTELLNSGVELFTSVFIRDYSEVELGCLCSALSEFSKNPMIGGQNNKGHGKIDIVYSVNESKFFMILDFNKRTSEKFDNALSSYNNHIESKRPEIMELLK